MLGRSGALTGMRRTPPPLFHPPLLPPLTSAQPAAQVTILPAHHLIFKSSNPVLCIAKSSPASTDADEGNWDPAFPLYSCGACGLFCTNCGCMQQQQLPLFCKIHCSSREHTCYLECDISACRHHGPCAKVQLGQPQCRSLILSSCGEAAGL